MALEFNVDEEIAKVDTRSVDEIKAASEGLSLAQYKMDRWFNERKNWLEFFTPREVGFFERVLDLGLRFRCLNCREKDFDVIGQWFNPQFSKFSQHMGPGNHCVYRCRACGSIRTARKAE